MHLSRAETAGDYAWLRSSMLSLRTSSCSTLRATDGKHTALRYTPPRWASRQTASGQMQSYPVGPGGQSTGDRTRRPSITVALCERPAITMLAGDPQGRRLASRSVFLTRFRSYVPKNCQLTH